MATAPDDFPLLRSTHPSAAERKEQSEEPDAEERDPKPDGDAALHELQRVDDTGDGQHHDDQPDGLPKESPAHKLIAGRIGPAQTPSTEEHSNGSESDHGGNVPYSAPVGRNDPPQSDGGQKRKQEAHDEHEPTQTIHRNQGI